jgi:uncharacterized protein
MTRVPRLILDVNVLLNAITTDPATIFGRLYERFRRGEVRFVSSESLLFEFGRILDYPRIQTQFRISPASSFAVARDLLLLGEYIEYVPNFDWPSLHDPKDWYLLDLLLESQANALITQDQGVIKAGKALDLPVLHPRELKAAGFI